MMLVLIIIAATILRFYKLSSIPPGLDWDEVSTVYNGYSILLTGKDEFLQKLPILFRSFDAYTPPVLVYLNSISTAFFSLNELAARIPNAFLGTLSIVGIYLLTKELTRNKKLSLLASLLLAISPWHIMYTRVNFYSILPVFFIIFATWFFLRSLTQKTFYMPSIVFFILAIFSYYSAYIFVPIFILFLVFTYRKSLSKLKILFTLLMIFSSVAFVFLLAPGGQVRLLGVSAISDPDLLRSSSRYILEEKPIGNILHNRRLIYGQKIIEGYFDYFRLDFLFGKADAITRMNVPGPAFGLLYIWSLPFLIYGLYKLVNKKPLGWQVIVFWLFAAPIAASVALPKPVSTRVTIMIPVLQIITAYGFWQFTKSRSLVITRLFILLLIVNFILFSHQYFYHFPQERSQYWFYGYRELFNFVNQELFLSNNTHFVYKNMDYLDTVHAFTLFYNKIDPLKYQLNGGTTLGCYGNTGQFRIQRFNFRPYNCDKNTFTLDDVDEDDLIVTSRIINEDTVTRINALNGNELFYVYKFEKVKDLLPEFVSK